MNPAADANPTGTDMVVRRGKIFEVGSFPDRDFSMDEAELAAAVAAFTKPVPLDLEHVPTILDGKLGHVRKVWISDDGREMHGEAEMPSWLDNLLDSADRKVSATWNRATKSLEKLALVRNPKIRDAALFAAFSAAHPIEAVESIVNFATPRKRHDHATAHHQVIHDMIRAGYPGVCSGGPMRPPGADDADAPMAKMSLEATFANYPEQLKALKDIHKTTTMNGAVCGSGKVKMSEQPTISRRPSMSTATDSVAFADSPEYLAFQAKLEAAEAKAAELSAKLAETSAESAATAAQFAATRAELEVARVKQVAIDAKAFALAEITAGRSTAAEYKDLIADFSDAAEADHKSKELVTFSDATGASVQGTRVEKLKAREARRQSHGLFSPALGDGALTHDGERLLFNDKGTDNAASDRVAADAVLAKFNDGQAVLNRRKAAK